MAKRTSTEQRFWANVSGPDARGCRIWFGRKNSCGYGSLWVTELKKSVGAHRWIWEQTFGAIPGGAEICHHCDTPACVEVTHLFLGDRATNMADMAAKGRHGTLWGERNGRAKLTEDQVREIRQLYGAGGWTFAGLGRQYGVAYQIISAIVRRTSWSKVE